MTEEPARALDELAARTPPDRDRYVDFLRGLSILVVVIGHWLVGVIYWEEGVIGTYSAIAMTPGLWIVTWFVMVMPIFFFVGGFSNLVSYRSSRRRGESTGAWLRSRLGRLLGPTLVLLGVWMVVQVALRVADLGAPTTPYLRGVEPPGATVPFGPLWFLAVYLGVILLAPLMIGLHERFGLAVPVVMVVGAVAADALGFVGGISEVRWANVAFVWLLPHQLGFFYADGRITRLSPKALTAMAIGGVVAMLLLTNPVFGEAGQRWFPGIGHYPKGLAAVGAGVEPFTNTYPPTIVLVAMTFWSIGLTMLFRGRVNRWLQRVRPWKAVILVNSAIMTLFLWHMTAFLLAVLMLWPAGLGQQGVPTIGWWAERPIWVAVPGVILLGIVAVFGRFERAAGRR
jgi:peptidoglycan/LPS O-acetylase OafA/YrhL